MKKYPKDDSCDRTEEEALKELEENHAGLLEELKKLQEAERRKNNGIDTAEISNLEAKELLMNNICPLCGKKMSE